MEKWKWEFVLLPFSISLIEHLDHFSSLAPALFSCCFVAPAWLSFCLVAINRTAWEIKGRGVWDSLDVMSINAIFYIFYVVLPLFILCADYLNRHVNFH